MRIDPRFAAGTVTTPLRSGRAGTTRFELEDGPAAKAATGARSSAPLATLDAILQLQAEDPGERRRRSARRGQDLLASLDSLKAALLGGAVSASDLGRITGSLAGAGSSGDPGLDAIVAEIELRAKVELAKLGRADLT